MRGMRHVKGVRVMPNEGRIIERGSDGFTFRYYEAPGGKRYGHFDCERRLESAINAMRRWFSRSLRTRTTHPPTSADRYELERLRQVADELAEYATVIQREIDKLEGVDRKAERIKALRVVDGRTPEETALFLAKADRLEGTTT